MSGKGARRTTTKPNQNLSRDTRRRAAVDRRRAAHRRSAQVAARRRRNRIIAGALAALLVVGGVVTVVAAVRKDEPAVASTELNAEIVEGATGELGVTDAPEAYKVVYEIHSQSGDTETVTTEDVAIQRPFNSLLTAKEGAAPGGTTQWQLTSNIGKYSESASGATPTVQAIAPRSALGDYRFDVSLPDLVADGTFVARERRTALGRECQVYRTGSAVESFAVSKPTDTDYSDVCIDAAGIPLEEVTVTGGELSSRLVATSVDDASQPAADAFTITGEPAALTVDGGSQLTPVDVASVPVPGYWVPTTPPAGYTLQGRYKLSRAQTPVADDDGTGTTTTSTAPVAPTVVESYIDVYTNGIDTIVIQQGLTAAEPASEASNGSDVTVGALGTAKLAAGISGASLLAHPAAPADWFIELVGTTSKAALQAVAADLHS